jgi:hypothetical protein
MTRLVDDEAMAVLLKQLSLIDRMVDVVEANGSRYIHDAIEAARSTVNQWPAVAPMVSETGAKRELIQADFIGECGEHGLFWNDELGRAMMYCPECQRERERDPADEAMYRTDEIHDRLRDERNIGVHPTLRGIVNGICPDKEAANG